MDFIARLKHTSTIWHDWRGSHRLSGLISGVLFHLTKDQNYVSDVLDPTQVLALQHHTSVRLEVATNVAIPVGMVPDTVVEETSDAELDRLFEESLNSPEPVVEEKRDPPPRPVPDPPTKPPPTPPKTSYEAQRAGRYAAQQRFPNKGRR